MCYPEGKAATEILSGYADNTFGFDENVSLV
jgi:hypothetical protein